MEVYNLRAKMCSALHCLFTLPVLKDPVHFQALVKSVNRFFICDRKLDCKIIRYLFTAFYNSNLNELKHGPSRNGEYSLFRFFPLS